MTFKMRLVLLPLVLLLAAGCSPRAEQYQAAESLADDALRQARVILGPDAEILRQGYLNRPGIWEAILVVKLKGLTASGNGFYVSKGVILERHGDGWLVALELDRAPKNGIGYLGVDFLDQMVNPPGFYLEFEDNPISEPARCILWVTFLNPRKEPEGTAIEIRWNPRVNRYQEWAYDQMPPRFTSEFQPGK